MSDMRKAWMAVCKNFGAGIVLRSRYLSRTLSGSSYVVTLPLEISEGGRGHVGRKVSVDMHPDQARRLAESLRVYADRAEQMNDSAGYRSIEETEGS